jgi:hypothetical protein
LEEFFKQLEIKIVGLHGQYFLRTAGAFLQSGGEAGRECLDFKLGELGGICEREFRPEYTAAAVGVFEADGAVHRVQQSLAESESNACAFNVAGLGAEAFEGHKEAVAFFQGDARSGIPHFETGSGGCEAEADENHAAFVVVFDGVGKEVENDLV